MLNSLTIQKDVETFSLSAENPMGEKGKGAMALVGEGSASAAAKDLGQGWKVNPYIISKAKSTSVLADIRGQGAIKHIFITESAKAGRDLILRIYFDDCKNPAVHVPLSDFFLNADNHSFAQINSLPICFNPNRAMNCYFEMPYFKSFRMEIDNLSDSDCRIYYQIDCEKKRIDPKSLYFHAMFNRVNPLPYKEVYTILEKIKGNGVYVGTYMHWNVKSNGWWGEGEIKFYIDGDKEFPTVCGTGTEDYFCGAWDFEINNKYIPFSSPYTGLSKVGYTDETYHSQRYFDMYRFHITDPIYFKKDLKVTMQALGWRNDGRYLPLQDDISSVAYWYSDNLDNDYPPFPSKDDLELIL